MTDTLEAPPITEIAPHSITATGVIIEAMMGYRRRARDLRESGDAGPNRNDLAAMTLDRFFTDPEFLADRVHLGKRLREAQAS